MMDAWHILNSDLNKGLGFVTPFFAHQQKMWKHSSSATPALYNAIDAATAGMNGRGTVKLLKQHKMWDVYREFILEVDPVFSAMTKAGMPVDLASRVVSSKQLIERRKNVHQKIEAVVPREIRTFSPPNGYIRPPKDLSGLTEITVDAVLHKECSNCQQREPNKGHFKSMVRRSCSLCGAKWTTKHSASKRGKVNPCSEGVEVRSETNPCAGRVAIEIEVGEKRWARVEDFKVSPKSIQRYQLFNKHPFIFEGKGAERKVSCDEKALKKLIGKWPEHEFYNLCIEDRELSTIGSRYIGWFDSDSGQLSGGFPTGRDGRIHGHFKHTPSTLRSSMVAPNLQNCYSDDTQVLTPNGWKLFQDLIESDKIAQANADGSIEFVVPSQLISQAYIGPMIDIKGEYINIRVTPEHRMISWTRNGNLCNEPASKWLDSWGGEHIIDREVRRGGFRVGGQKLTADERLYLSKAIAVQAEGYVRSDTPQVEVAIKSDRKKQQLVELWGAEVRVRKDDWVAWVKFTDPCLEWLELPSKNFKTAKLLALCSEDLDWLIDEVMKWDGDYTRGCTYLQAPKRRAAVEAVQLAAVLSGKSTSWYIKPTSGYECVNIHKSYKRYASRLTIQQSNYSGRVHCATVPSGMLLVRRDNDIIVCGNCPRGDDSEVQAWVKQMFVAPPGMIFIERDFSGIEAKLVGYHCGSKDYIRLASIDVHSYLTAHNLYRQGKFLFTDLPNLNWSDSDLKAYLKTIKKKFPFERTIAKICVHSANYRIGPKHLSEQHPTVFHRIKDAAVALSGYYEVFPEIPKWHERICLQVDKTCVYKNAFGHIQRFYDVLSWSKKGNQWVWDYSNDAKRLIAAGPQSDAALIGKKALKRLYYNYPDTLALWLRLFIHDSNLAECPIERADYADEVMRIEMEQPIEELPLDASWGLGEYLAIGTESKRGICWGAMS